MRAEQIPLNFEKPSEEDKPQYDLSSDDESQPDYKKDHDWRGVNLRKKWTPQKKKKLGGK